MMRLLICTFASLCIAAPLAVTQAQVPASERVSALSGQSSDSLPAESAVGDAALVFSTGAPPPPPIIMTPGSPVNARITSLRDRLENPSRRCGDDCLSPVEAVTYAAYLAPRAALASDFKFQVKAVGSAERSWFLNSEEDYRDRNCLTVRMSPAAADSIRRTYGNRPLEDIFKGRTVQVRGIARRVRIDFIDDGQPTGKYYYQTHVNVDNARQLAFLDAPAK